MVIFFKIVDEKRAYVFVDHFKRYFSRAALNIIDIIQFLAKILIEKIAKQRSYTALNNFKVNVDNYRFAKHMKSYDQQQKNKTYWYFYIILPFLLQCIN